MEILDPLNLYIHLETICQLLQMIEKFYENSPKAIDEMNDLNH
jgi:hypothetical protein